MDYRNAPFSVVIHVSIFKSKLWIGGAWIGMVAKRTGAIESICIDWPDYDWPFDYFTKSAFEYKGVEKYDSFIK